MLGFFNFEFKEGVLYGLVWDEIDIATQHGFHGLLKLEELHEGAVPAGTIEHDEQIDVTFGTEVRPENRTKGVECLDVMAATQTLNLREVLN